MDKTSMFMIFESAQRMDGKQQYVNPIPSIHLDSVPGKFSFVIVFCVSGLNCKPEHTISLSFTSPSGKETCLIDNQTMKSAPSDGQKEVIGTTLSVDIRNYSFEMEGIYTVNYTIDDDHFNGNILVSK